MDVLGRRLAWVSKWLKCAQAYGASAGSAGLDNTAVRLLLGASGRAAFFAAEK